MNEQPESMYAQPCNEHCRLEVRHSILGQDPEVGWVKHDQLPIEYGRLYEMRHSHRDPEGADFWVGWQSSYPFKSVPPPSVVPD